MGGNGYSKIEVNRKPGRRLGGWALGLTGVVELAAATLTTHAAARLTDNAPLLAVEYLHQLGAAIWIVSTTPA